jgi:hypothetical protein
MIAMISFWLLIPIPFGNYILTLSLIISTLSLSTHSSHEVEEIKGIRSEAGWQVKPGDDPCQV